MRLLLACWLFALGLSACAPPLDPGPSEASSTGASGPTEALDSERARCEARVSEVLAEKAMPGAPDFEAERVAFLGRARGASTLFVRAPAQTPDDALGARARAERERLSREAPGYRIARLVARLGRDRAALRSILLREGYVYADDPLDAFELAERVTLVDLFDEPRLLLERGRERLELERRGGKWPEYVVASGPGAGSRAKLIFGDRVSVADAPRAEPLHRDVLGFARDAGFDRIELEHLGRARSVVRLRFGQQWARALVRSEGATLELECLAEPLARREQIAAHLRAEAPRRRALAALREAISRATEEALPFDRPRGETGPDRDGELRPHWISAYLSGRQGFVVDEQHYSVFDAFGRPAPPTVCMDFALESFERASGSWFRPRGEPRGRAPGKLDWNAFGIENRRGVLGFSAFAKKRPDLFELHELPARERVPFAERARFFDALQRDEGRFAPGDILAIQGLKRDDRVHQHAIVLEALDPLTGFPSELADQMRAPRRRSWEAIMAEAPKRSLLYRARPRDEVWKRLDPDEARSGAPSLEARLQR